MKFLPERHRHRILQLGAPHFQHIIKADGFIIKALINFSAVWNSQRYFHIAPRERRSGDIIGRLAAIHIVVRI